MAISGLYFVYFQKSQNFEDFKQFQHFESFAKPDKIKSQSQYQKSVKTFVITKLSFIWPNVNIVAFSSFFFTKIAKLSSSPVKFSPIWT